MTNEKTFVAPVEIDMHKLFLASEQINRIIAQAVVKPDGTHDTVDVLGFTQAVCGTITARYGAIFPREHIDSFRIAIEINERVHALIDAQKGATCH